MRNPFRLRAAQRAVSDDDFVRLFGAGALDLIDEVEDPWCGLVFLRSAPGGGKTSFLRLLTPRPLKIASLLHDDPLSRPTYLALNAHRALEDGRPAILGVFSAFTNEYRDLEELDQAGGMFRALLNARIVIATVRAVLEHDDKNYPQDLGAIKTRWKARTNATIPAEATGQELFEWASEIERRFYDQLDELGDGGQSGLGHPHLDALDWFAQAELDGAHGPITAKRILLFDDLQFLSASQRRTLTELLMNARVNCGIWIAERMEALNHQEILSEGALKGRDYQGIIRLEGQWARRLQSYTKFVSQIADLRARRAENFNDREFFSLIAENEDVVTWRDRFEQAATDIRASIKEMAKSSERYLDWIDSNEASEGDIVEKAIRWRATQILVARDLTQRQSALGFYRLTAADYENRDSSGVNRAAEHFLRREIGAPIYFGKETLALVSSANVDQYIDVGGDLFEEIAASIAGPRSNPAPLTADRQHALIKSAAERRWSEIARRVPQGYAARRFLDALGVFCQQQTNRPTAPYAPGVTGFGLPMKERARLIDDDAPPAPYALLRDVLTTLVAHNLLTPRLDHRNKGREYVVFYMNRLLCAHFDLPLGYGGWRDRSLRVLSLWAENGRRAVKEERLVE